MYKLAKSYTSVTMKSRIDLVWPKMRKFIHFLKRFQTVSFIALKNHVPLPRFPETFNMWYRTVHGRKYNIGFISVTICGGYISKYPRLSCKLSLLTKYKIPKEHCFPFFQTPAHAIGMKPCKSKDRERVFVYETTVASNYSELGVHEQSLNTGYSR